MQVVLFTDCKCVEDLACVPVGCGPVEAPAFLNNLVEASADFLKRSEVIVKMSVDNVNVIQLQAIEASLDSFSDVLPADDQLRVDIGLRSA